MRLPAMGFTLPWQLVAAQEPGPMYLIGSGVSVAAESAAVMQRKTPAKSSARRENPLWQRIRMR
jgi:hypothetical protein